VKGAIIAGVLGRAAISRQCRTGSRFPGAAQHGAKRNDALQTRDRGTLRAWFITNSGFGTIPEQRRTTMARANALMVLRRIRGKHVYVT
jgi:hypothetical protein